MSDQLPMFEGAILRDSDSATSSPELPSGLIPSDLPDGPTTASVGQEAVPVPVSPSRVKAKGLQILVTSGRYGMPSSASAALESSLVSRLMERFGHGWLDLVSTDLEAEKYAFAAAVLGAHSVGAPHRRQRLYFVGAITSRSGHDRARAHEAEPSGNGAHDGLLVGDGNLVVGCESTGGRCTPGRTGATVSRQEPCGSAERSGESRGTDDAQRPRLEGYDGDERDGNRPGWLDADTARSIAAAGATRGFWRDCDWWYGRDGKYRPIGQGIQPLCGSTKRSILSLASGTTEDIRLVRDLGEKEPESSEARVLRLRGYGDCIVAPLAAEFIQAVMKSLDSVVNPVNNSLDYGVGS